VTTYEVTSERVELPYGVRFTLELPPTITQGALCLWQVGIHLIIGRAFESWIIQPDRWIHVGAAAVKCMGHIVLLLAM